VATQDSITHAGTKPCSHLKQTYTLLAL